MGSRISVNEPIEMDDSIDSITLSTWMELSSINFSLISLISEGLRYESLMNSESSLISPFVNVSSTGTKGISSSGEEDNGTEGRGENDSRLSAKAVSCLLVAISLPSGG